MIGREGDKLLVKGNHLFTLVSENNHFHRFVDCAVVLHDTVVDETDVHIQIVFVIGRLEDAF
ncbi:hypothetical protein D3C84_1046090 [compost metagenome]